MVHGNTKHGMYGVPEYFVWTGMRQRCRNKNDPSYHHYGGRGILVCSRWDSFNAFISDMGFRPTPKHSIDRIDNNGDYNSDNCQWATVVQQRRNQNIRKDNKSGVRGVFFDSKLNRWIANISLSKKRLYLSSFKTVDEAKEVRLDAEKEHWL